MEAIQRFIFFVHLLLVVAWSSFTTIRYYLTEIVVAAASIALAVGSGVGQWQLHGQEISRAEIEYLNQPSFSRFQDLVKKIHQKDTASAAQLVKAVDREWSESQKKQLGLILDETVVLRGERDFWLSILPQQPTHRDLLWNLRTLENALGEKEQTRSYELQAKRVDPNFAFK